VLAGESQQLLSPAGLPAASLAQHLVLKAVSEQGEHLNMRKATLHNRWQQFATHLREQRVAANATERAVRGQSRTKMPDGLFRDVRRHALT
jgi:heme oxygenase